MKSWTVPELNNVVLALEPLVGLRLQEVQTSAQDVVLGFYSTEGLLWLWVDLNALAPTILPWSKLPFRLNLQKNPLHLFLKAHFLDRILTRIHLAEEFGRRVYLYFGDDSYLELRLFAHSRNLLAFAGAKKIAWQKPSAVPPLQTQHASSPSARGLEDLRTEWLSSKQGAKAVQKSSVNHAERLQNDLKKKERALEKVDEDLKRKQDLPYKAVGDWLKVNQSLDVPTIWEPFVDKRRKLAWNIEQCFVKAREASGKIVGTLARREILLQEISRLRNELTQPERSFSQGAKPPPSIKNEPSLAAISAQGRTLRLTEDLTVVAGKSAVDNMKILRKARAWDLWFHLRDYPSSHAILFRNKGREVTEGELRQVGIWFIRTHLGAKAAEQVGEKFSLAITECRHVKPIRGDKIGRVTFHNERVLTLKLQ